jgi:arylsulfatase A
MINRNLFFAGTFLFSAGCTDPVENEKPALPNVIYILADDMGYGDVSCYNENSKIKTPHIDQLAAEGVLFTDAHTSSAVCTPTRYGILTGRYNWRSTLKRGVLSGYSKALIGPNRMTAGKMLQLNDYHTAFIGKWHLGWDWHVTAPADWQSGPLGSSANPEVDFSKPIQNGPEDRGFTYSYGFSGSLDMPPYVYVENSRATTIPTDTTVCVDDKGFWRKGLTGSDFIHVDVLPHITHKSVHYINERAQSGQPFFLYFALPAPHTPILPTTAFMGKSNTNFYGDFVVQVDDVVGKITEAVDKNGIGENTIIIFTTDNGCSPKANFAELKSIGHDPSYIFRGSKADIYEGGHRVPFVLRWPQKVKAGSKTGEIICTTDLMATLAEVVGYSLPDDAAEDSYSFLPAIISENNHRPLREATVHHSIDGRFALRQGDWKLILWPGSGGWSYPRNNEITDDMPRMQLYNLKSDPAESQNLIEKHPEKATELKILLMRYITLGRSTPGEPQENEGMETWKELAEMQLFE